MSSFAVTLLLAAAAGLGLYLGTLYLRGERKPLLIGLHLLLGFGGLEGVLILQHGAPNGDAARSGSLGTLVAVLLAVGALCAFTAAVIRRQSHKNAEMALLAHVSLAGLGVLLFLVWVAGGS